VKPKEERPPQSPRYPHPRQKLPSRLSQGIAPPDGDLGNLHLRLNISPPARTALQQIRGLGTDMALDPGMGNCGKQGQWVPVGVGQPRVLIGGLTVGGSAT